MAYPALSNMKENPFFITAYKQGAVPYNEFGFYLSTNNSELYLGGTNPDLYSGDIEYHNLSSSSGFWQIGGAKATVNGKVTNTNFDTIINSGNSPSSTAY
jgi:cathepsin D